MSERQQLFTELFLQHCKFTAWFCCLQVKSRECKYCLHARLPTPHQKLALVWRWSSGRHGRSACRLPWWLVLSCGFSSVVVPPWRAAVTVSACGWSAGSCRESGSSGKRVPAGLPVSAGGSVALSSSISSSVASAVLPWASVKIVASVVVASLASVTLVLSLSETYGTRMVAATYSPSVLNLFKSNGFKSNILERMWTPSLQWALGHPPRLATDPELRAVSLAVGFDSRVLDISPNLAHPAARNQRRALPPPPPQIADCRLPAPAA